MHPRRALLKKIASVNGSFDGSDTSAFTGETCIETRNTIYRFKDGVCFAVMSRDQTRRDRASAILGMRIVGWLVAGPPPRLTYAWQPRTCAVLWRACASGEEDGSMALTSPTIDFTRGLTSARLQAIHDDSPPIDSSLYRRADAPAPPASRADAASVTRFHPQPNDPRPRLTLVPPPPRRSPFTR
jgi:hypothetical protein